ncbi:protein LURP-one-related 8-like protein [Carex littledalei]|uniref:Protein LURP-one-related 8-like protein n=1 Tax=Carex littledalei TaxID=544730 RepID=A0A833VKZ1_9POAL|nr:protein LURP-one-related 8-like protein [Carex littledalei]
MKAFQRMKKVHPSLTSVQSDLRQVNNQESRREEAEVLTVWRKSLLFNCSGFTVYDAKGNLVFRVDNYGSDCKSEVVLMDATGKPLFSIRKKRQLNLGYHWVIYNKEDSTNPLLSVKRHTTMRNKKSLAEVTPFAPSLSTSSFLAEGSYAQRCCTFQNNEGTQVAEIRRKEVLTSSGGVNFGDDVFQLVVEPEIDTCLAMGIVIALDQMAASRPYLMRSWSS